MINLNVGSYINMFYGWVNIDKINLSDFAKQNRYEFKQIDVEKDGLREYRDGTVDLIVASHFLEHLDRNEGKKFLSECLRILKYSGIIRLTIPDATTICKAYLGLEDKYIMDYKEFNIGVEKSKDDAEALFELLLAGHKTIYNFESLRLILQEAGFDKENIKQMKFLESRNPIIEKSIIDMYPEISIYVEAKKPNIDEKNVDINTKSNDTINKNWTILIAGNANKDTVNNNTEAIKPTNNNTEAIKPTNNNTEAIKPTNIKGNIEFKFSIVYITYRPGGYDLLLSSLLQQTYKNYELIVVDDYPGRPEIIKPIFEFHKIPLKYFGPSKQKCYPNNLYGGTNAINTGAIISSGDIIILLQDYTYLFPDTLENWNVAFNNTGLDTVITGGATIYTSPIPNNWHGLLSIWDKPINEDISKLPGFNRKEDWIPEKYEGFYTGIPRKIMEHLNGFDEYYDSDDGGSVHDFFGRVMIAGYNTSVNRKLLCNMIDHRSWHPPNKDEDHLWHVMRQEKFRDKPQNEITWQERIQKIKEGKEPLRTKNCFDMRKDQDQSKSLRIALISTPFFTVPPKGYGGLEQVVYDLAEALDELGHEVTLFAPEGSKSTTHGHLVVTGPSILTTNVNWFEEEKKRYDVYKDIITPDEFDIVHDHTWFAFPYLLKAKYPNLKILHTMHGGLSWESPPNW